MTSLLAVWVLSSVLVAMVLSWLMGDGYELDLSALANSAARAA